MKLSHLLTATLTALICLLPLCRPATAAGETLAPGLQPAIALLESGEHLAARDALLALFREDPSSAQINFYLGLAEVALEDYENACLAFERTLMAEPDMALARLELGRVYAKLGLPDTAKSYLNEVLDGNPPENVRRNIQRLIKQIDAAGRKSGFTGVLSLGLTYDTNVAASPTASTISTPSLGIPFVTVEDEESDAYLSMSVALEHRYRPEDRPVGWRSSLLYYNASFFSAHEQNLDYVRIASGPSFERTNRLIDVMFVAEYLAKESDEYYNAYGMEVRYAQALRDRHFLTGQVLLLNKDYNQTPDREALNLSVNFGPIFTWTKQRLITRLGFETEDARGGDVGVEEDELSFDRWFIQGRYERLFDYGITAYAGYRFSRTEYAADYAAFGEDRVDMTQAWLAGIQKKITPSLVLDISNTFSKAKSTIELYEYDRNLVSLNVRWSF